MPDLLHTAAQNTEAEIDYSALKINGLGFAGALFAFGHSYLLNSILGGASGASYAVSSLILAALFLIVVFLQSIFIKDTGRLGIILFLETVSMFLPFIFYISSFILAGTVIAYLFLLWGSVGGKQEMRDVMKIRIFRLGKFVLPKAITALSIFVAAGYVSFFQDQNLVMSRETFMKIVPAADGVAKFVYPQMSFNDSFTLAVEAVAGGGKMTPEQIEASRARLSELIKLDFDTSDTLINIIYDAYKNYAIMIPPSQKILILMLLGLVLFTTVRTVGAPLYWLVALMTWIIYEALLALGFAVVVLETRSKEIVLLK